MFRYYKHLVKEFGHHLHEAIDKPNDTENIHRLRLSIRKIRSLFRLLKRMDKDFPCARHFTYWKELFRWAGELHDMQIERDLAISWAERLHLLIGFNRPGTAGHIKAYTHYFDKAFYKTVEADVRRTTRHRPSRKLMRRYVEKKVAHIHHILSMSNVERLSSMHDMRKGLKELNDSLPLLRKYVHPAVPAGLADWMHEVRKQLGNWLDHGLLLKSLEHTRAFYFQDEAALNKMKEAVWAEHKHLYDALMQCCDAGLKLFEAEKPVQLRVVA